MLNNRQQQTGCLIDVLVESSRPHQGAYAIISANRLLNHVEHFAVPLQLLNEDERRWLVVDANRESFEQAKPFDLTNREDHRKQVGRMFRLSPDRSLPAADTSTTKPDDVMVTKEITTASDGF